MVSMTGDLVLDRGEGNENEARGIEVVLVLLMDVESVGKGGRAEASC